MHKKTALCSPKMIGQQGNERLAKRQMAFGR
jgi:hypothetical protein